MNLNTLPGSFRNPLDGRLVEPGRIIGYRRDGRPIYVIAGGDGTGGDGGQSGGQSGGNSGAGDGGQGGSGQGGNTGGTGQQGGQSGGQQQGGNTGGQGGGQSGTGEAQTVEQLPGWAQRVISDLRRENAAKRTGGNDGGQGQGQQQNGQQGGPGGSQQSQQGNNAGQSDAAIQAAQATARDSVLKLTAYQSAGKNGADADLLLDSVSFVGELSKLDPTADDFGSKLSAAIKKAVEDNPKLKAVQAAGRSGGEFTGGPGGGADTTPAPGKARIRAAYGS